jgi:hypothetical protein
LPPALPLSLLDISPRSLQDILAAMRSRLSFRLPSDFSYNVRSEHTGLKRDVNISDDLKRKLEEAANPAGAADYFRTCWEPLNGNYPHLQHFAGGLSTVFPGSSTVESNFSVLKFENSDHLTSLSDVCIEKIFRARQLRKSSSFKWNLRTGTFVLSLNLRIELLTSLKVIKSQCYRCTEGSNHFLAEDKKFATIVRNADHNTSVH